MQQIEGQPAEVKLTITLTRATGEEKTVEVVGFTDPARLEQFLKEERHGDNTQHCGA